jgi:outer membrane protein TolC
LTCAPRPSYANAVRILLVMCVAFGAFAAHAQEPTAVDLPELLRRARADNPAVKIAEADLKKYQALFERARFSWTPTIRADGLLIPLPERRLLRQCVDPTSPVGEVIPCPGQNVQDDLRLDAESEIGILVRLDTRFTFPIYTFGKIDSAKRAASAGLRVGAAGVDVARGKLDVLVKQAYYGAQYGESALKILRDGAKRMDKAKRNIQKELDKESGKFTSNDLRKLKVEEAELKAGILQAEARTRYAWESIRIAGGFPSRAAFTLDTLRLKPVYIEPRSVEQYVELALKARPDLRYADAGIDARRAQVDMERANYWPDIALTGVFGFAYGSTADDNPDPFANDNFNYLTYGAVLAARLNLDVFKVRAAVGQAEAALLKAEAQLKTLKVQIRLQIVEEVQTLDRRGKEVKLRKKAMKAGKGWMTSNFLNFGLGLVTTNELISSLTAYSKTRLAYYEAIYEYNLAVARLSQTVGVELAVPRPADE